MSLADDYDWGEREDFDMPDCPMCGEPYFDEYCESCRYGEEEF